MKKALLFVAFLLIVFSLSASNLDEERLSMGNLKAAMNLENPAMVSFYNQNHKVLVNFGPTFNAPSAFPYVLKNGASFVVVGDNMLLDLDLGWYYKKQDDGYYTLRHRLSAKTTLSYRAGNFSFGMGFAGASERERNDVKIEEKFFSGFFSETFFGRYFKVEDSEEVELSAGAAYSNNGFTFALLCENIFESSDVSDYKVSVDSISEQLDIGAFYEMDRYNKRGRLRKNVASFGIEGQNLWSEKESSINTGIKYMFQFNRNLSAFFMTGTEIKLSNVLDRSVHMMGLGMEYNPVKVTVNTKIPYRLYQNSNCGESAVINVIIGLTF